MLTWLKIGVGALAGASLAFTGGFFYGQFIQRQSAAVDALTTSVKVLRSRGETDAEISVADAADLCGSMGLSKQDQLECVRRLAIADADAGKRVENHDGR